MADSTNPHNSSKCPRTLTDDERSKLDKDTTMISDFKREKLEKEAIKNWDLFYKRNSANFFKDRHWTTREFQELLCDQNQPDQKTVKVILEAGCGVGNFFYPLLEEGYNLYINACDCSPRAVQFVKKAKDLCGTNGFKSKEISEIVSKVAEVIESETF
ncbi:Methyltransferase-like protein 6 [Exaiptasia diaphana]|nr:Methyltransferase-like protein 6 [Exaiptasia diaphana]